MTVSGADQVKIPTPDLYHEDREKLDAYLMQVELYIKKYPGQSGNTEDKVLFASTYLRGDAFKWFHHFLEDYLFKEPSQRDRETQIVFSSAKAFETRLRRVFGDIDKERTAERQLYGLR